MFRLLCFWYGVEQGKQIREWFSDEGLSEVVKAVVVWVAVEGLFVLVDEALHALRRSLAAPPHLPSRHLRVYSFSDIFYSCLYII